MCCGSHPQVQGQMCDGYHPKFKAKCPAGLIPSSRSHVLSYSLGPLGPTDPLVGSIPTTASSRSNVLWVSSQSSKSNVLQVSSRSSRSNVLQVSSPSSRSNVLPYSLGEGCKGQSFSHIHTQANKKNQNE